jgi:hypothetical protein
VWRAERTEIPASCLICPFLDQEPGRPYLAEPEFAGYCEETVSAPRGYRAESSV